MIIKSKTGSNGGGLAAYLMKEHQADREKAELVDLRGFATHDLSAALKSIDLEASTTHCKKPLYHVSFRPDKGEHLTPEQWDDCINRLEHRLGLDDQPRAVVMHEHEGEQHLHVVWSRIDRENNKAVELIFDHERCIEIAREIEREYGLRVLAPAHERAQEPLTRADYEQARRTGRDVAEVREVKDLIREAWEQSDNGASFQNALHDAGLTLAQGDTARAPFVVVDEQGKVYGVARTVGEKTQDTRARLGDLDKELLPTVTEARGFQQEQHRQPEQVRAEREAEPLQQQQAPAPLPEVQKPRFRFDLDNQQWTRADLAREIPKAKTSTPDRETTAAPNVTRAAAAIGDKILDVAGDLLGGIGGPVTHEQIQQQAAGTQQRTAQQVQDAAAQIRQPLTPQEREAKAKESDRAAKEATRAQQAYKDAQANTKGEERRAAMRAEFRAEHAAKEAARAAARLRETEQQRQEREAKEREEREAERRRRERQRER